jgi:hypothetical protein
MLDAAPPSLDAPTYRPTGEGVTEGAGDPILRAPPEARHLLTGLPYCGSCGSRLARDFDRRSSSWSNECLENALSYQPVDVRLESMGHVGSADE